jgi:hypothetical protein
MSGPVPVQKEEGIRRCCSGHVPMAAPSPGCKTLDQECGFIPGLRTVPSRASPQYRNVQQVSPLPLPLPPLRLHDIHQQNIKCTNSNSCVQRGGSAALLSPNRQGSARYAAVCRAALPPAPSSPVSGIVRPITTGCVFGEGAWTGSFLWFDVLGKSWPRPPVATFCDGITRGPRGHRLVEG